MNKRIIIFITFLLIAEILFCSCFGNEEKVESDVSEESEEESSVEPVPPYYYDDTAPLLLMVGGEERKAEFDNDSEDENGLASVFGKRIDTIRDIHGISFDILCVPENDDMPTETAARIESGLETDLILYGASSFGKHVFSSLYYDLCSLDVLSPLTEKESSVSLSLCGKQFFLTGDVCMTSYDSAYALFFNKRLAKEYTEDDLYSVVTSGEWTIDKMNEYAKNSGNDPSFLSEKGVFGIVSKAEDVNAFMTSCGEFTVFKNEDGIPVRNVGTKTNIAFFEKLISFVSNNEYAGIAEKYGNWKITHNKEKNIFVSGNSLFMPYTLSLVSKEKNEYKDSIGIIPMPKKEISDEYITPLKSYSASVIGIPKSNTAHLEKTCACLLLLDYYGRKETKNEYISFVMENNSFDEQDGEMLSLICENLFFDIGELYVTTGSGDMSLGRIYSYSSVSGESFEVIVNPLLPAYERGIEEILSKTKENKSE